MYFSILSSNAFKSEKLLNKPSNIESTTKLRSTLNSINANDNDEDLNIPRNNYNAQYIERSIESPVLRILEEDNENNDGTLESKSPAKASIAFSTVWKMPKTVHNSSVKNESDQYISNLIRDSQNYEFGKIIL